jgi:predicted RNA-binding Zn-ribbon protein involved in translation (DUF1610 family)
MGHSENHRMELFVFPDGTAVEMIVFAPEHSASRTPEWARRERDAGPAEREAQPELRPTATQAPPPSGGEHDAPAHECPQCGCDLVYPEEWERSSVKSWNVTLRCPNCEVRRSVVLGREGVEALDREFYLGAQSLAREADSVTRRNFSEESARLVEALALDLILPMDF